MKKNITKKPKIAILSIRNTYKNGGVLSTIKTVYKFCQHYFDPTVFVLSFDNEISASIKNLKFSSSSRKTTFCDMNYVEIGSRWAFWEPGHYAFNIEQWKKELSGYDYFFVVSATPIAGHPLAQLNKKFPIWISTSYAGDRIERVKKLNGIRALINRLATPHIKKIEKDILNKASFIWALSTYSKKQFEETLGHSKKDLLICPQPIKINSQNNNIVRDPNMIISVGRFSDPRKNIDMLLKVFDKLHTKSSNLKLYIVGQKPTAIQISKFKSFSSFSNIIFTGPVDNQELTNLYSKASLKLITSYQEGFGIAGLEALAYGMPVVSTDCGGVKDFVINDKTGYLVEINDINHMAKKSLQILTNKKLHQKLCENGQELVQKQFSQENVFSLFKKGLQKVYPELTVFFTQVDQKK